MINLQLTIQEVDAVLKHIEQSAVQLIDKIRTQVGPQVMEQQQAAPVPADPVVTEQQS